jgi:ribosomal protein S27E
MDGEDGSGTWFTADEAIDASLADGYIPEEEALGAVACLGGDIYSKGTVAIDLSMYGNAPELHSPGRRISMSAKKKNATEMARAKSKAKAVGENVTVACPECEAEFDVDIDDDAEGTVEVTCPECGAVLNYDTESGEVTSAEEDGAAEEGGTEDNGAAGEGVESGEVAKAVAKALKADRERIVSLDQLAEIHPEQSGIIEEAKMKGTSYSAACRKVMDAVQSGKADGKAKGQDFLNGVKKDGEKTSKVGAAPNSGAEDSIDKVQQGIADSVAMFQGK